ncbi:MAG: hypothetical protein CL912_13545 [Deltaproteobacteria bacterium]|nr:hypothetical protein [Deltaproteobacteria bacterium]
MPRDGYELKWRDGMVRRPSLLGLFRAVYQNQIQENISPSIADRENPQHWPILLYRRVPDFVREQVNKTTFLNPGA